MKTYKCKKKESPTLLHSDFLYTHTQTHTHSAHHYSSDSVSCILSYSWTFLPLKYAQRCMHTVCTTHASQLHCKTFNTFRAFSRVLIYSDSIGYNNTTCWAAFCRCLRCLTALRSDLQMCLD